MYGKEKEKKNMTCERRKFLGIRGQDRWSVGFLAYVIAKNEAGINGSNGEELEFGRLSVYTHRCRWVGISVCVGLCVGVSEGGRGGARE